MEIRTQCAQSGAALQIFVDSELKWRVGTPNAQPLIFEPSVDWATFRKPNIVDDY